MMLDIKRRLTALENFTQLGNVTIQKGALQVLDPLGRLVLSLGYQPDGTLGLATYNPVTGGKVIDLGLQGDGTEGLAMFNPAGAKVLQVGQQPSGIYGLGVLQNGVLQLLSGVLGNFAPASQSTASGTAVSFGDGPTITATIGTSGSALVSIGGYILTSVAGVPNDIVVAVDGVIPRDGGGIPLLDVEGLTSVFGTAIVDGLTPGPHVFTHQYYAGGATTATYLHRQLTVQPL
jgi:hypothetical protein